MSTKKQSQERLEALKQSLLGVLIIHYSCENFDDKPDGYSPRISSIAIKNFTSGQTQSFSIHKVAEIEKIPRTEIEQHYDDLERKMLDEFFGFVDKHKSNIYVHWNMKSITYGFQAIYHRYRVLGGTPVMLDEGRLIDLGHTLGDIYGPNYIDHPRMARLIELNGITKLNFLTGAEEAEAFKRKEYYRLHLSTLRKVDAFAAILEKQLNNKLKTKVHPLISRVQDMHEHWLFQLAELILAIIGLVTTIRGIYFLLW